MGLKSRYREMMRRGVLITWTAEPIEGGCEIISIQAIAESFETRWGWPGDPDYVEPNARQKRRQKRA